MNTVADAGCPTATVNGRPDGKEFSFCATADASRMTVSNGMRTPMNNKGLGNNQQTCPDLQPANHNRDSVPTEWFLATTADTRPKHRRILHMDRQI